MLNDDERIKKYFIFHCEKIPSSSGFFFFSVFINYLLITYESPKE